MDPAKDSARHFLKSDAVDEGGRCATYTLGGSVFPHGSRVEVRLIVVVVVVGVKTRQHALVQSESPGYLGRPLRDEVILADVALGKHRIQLLIAVVLVLVLQGALGRILSAECLQIWHNLSDLEGVSVIGKREWCICPVDLVGYGTVEPISLEHLIPDWVIALACRAH